LAKHIEDRFGGLDILVNNAGFAFKQKATEPFGEQVHDPPQVLFLALHLYLDLAGSN
tara:strand:+ start:73 stop:243 length:171 start_codon:yes stop_codon:yes gene_type:complete